jgi:diguanylate cyclase (GGDEF)-like protein
LLYQAARIDPVTGFLQPPRAVARLEQELAKAGRDGRECAVLFIDLDKFKRVNDSFGHAAGDELLRTAASRLHGLLRPEDVLARFGGDEFIVLIPDLPPGGAAQMAADCASAIIAAMGAASSCRTTHQRHGQHRHRLLPTHGSDSDSLTQRRHCHVRGQESRPRRAACSTTP